MSTQFVNFSFQNYYSFTLYKYFCMSTLLTKSIMKVKIKCLSIVLDIIKVNRSLRKSDKNGTIKNKHLKSIDNYDENLV